MTTQLAVVITGAAVLLAVVGLLTTAAGRRMGLIHWVLAGLLEAVTNSRSPSVARAVGVLPVTTFDSTRLSRVSICVS